MSAGRGDAVKTVRKLIEVALPLDDLNRAAAREKSIRHGHPSTLHLWWARRPLAAARAVLFAQLVDDPSSRPDLFPTEEEQEQERNRLFAILRALVKWENTTNEELLEGARAEIRESWRRTCADNADHPRASELFDPERLPAFHDPFAGGGAIPLEAQRLGLEAHASDLNPVAVLINKAMIEIPPKFAGRPPVNPESRQRAPGAKEWKGVAGLAEDVRYYGQWMRDEAERRIGHLYPKVRVTGAMAAGRPDLERYAGRELTVIAWLWARTVHSPNPGFADVQVPLVSNFMLSTKKGKEAWVEPIVEGRDYRFEVRVGPPPDMETTKRGTKTAGSYRPFRCLVSGTPMPFDYLRSEGRAGRMGARLLAIVAEGDRGRVYLPPASGHEIAAAEARPPWKPEVRLEGKARANVANYGLTTVGDLFTERQLTALTTLSDLIGEAGAKARRDAISVAGDGGAAFDSRSLGGGGAGPAAYGDAVRHYLAFALSKQADLGNSLCRWEPRAECPRQLFGRQAIPIVWDYAEGNPLGSSSGAWTVFVDGITRAFEKGWGAAAAAPPGYAIPGSAREQSNSGGRVVSTDPPYFDNIGYADLSDFFYAWLRHSLGTTWPDLFSTLAAPKTGELIAAPYRHGSREAAEAFFLEGMTQAMRRLSELAHPSFPISIYYGFKQSETKSDTGVASTGWEAFLGAVIAAGFSITGTWPMRTENASRLVGMDRNALASSIVLVCRRRPAEARIAGRNEFSDALKQELPPALVELQQAGIAPVDLAQAALGPGMAVFSRYRSVNHVDGKPLTVREALGRLNEVLAQTLEEQEGDCDGDTRWAVAWFTRHHFDEGAFGDAETLSKAKNTSVAGLVEAGILRSGGGRVRLLRPEELPADWDPRKDRRRTVWETVHHLIRVLDTDGEMGAARLLRKMLDQAEEARALAHRLYAVCDRQQRPAEALAYNTLVGSWPEISRLARKDSGKAPALSASG